MTFSWRPRQAYTRPTQVGQAHHVVRKRELWLCDYGYDKVGLYYLNQCLTERSID
jgi:hypothetical protein